MTTKIKSGLIADNAIVSAHISSGAISSAHLSSIDTDNVSEGSSNLYFTTARARTSLSVTDSGGDGSLAYDNSTGAITYTGPSAAEVRAHLSAGTGVTYSSGEFSIGQSVATTASPTFADINVTGNINVTGDLNTVSVADLDVTDQTITLGAGQNEASSGGSGIVVDGSGASLLWDESNDEWDFNKSINITGDNKAVLVSSTSQDKIAFLGPRGSSGDAADEGLFYLKDGSSIVTQINSNGNSYFNGGKVGIGETSPRNVLHVKGNESGAQVVEIEQDNNAGIAGVHFSFNDTTVAHLGMAGASYTGNSEWTDKFFIGTISDKAVVISQNDIAAMTIDTDQNVIIGSGHNSSAPSHAIIKAAAASGFNNTGGDLRLYGGTSTGDNAGGEIEFYTGTAASSGTQANTPTERMRIDSSGDITVNNGILKGMSHLEIKNDYGTDGTATSPRLFSPASGTLAFSANGGERMRITSAGRISLSDSEGIKLSAKTSGMYALDGALSYYGTGNGVYLNGAGSNGWLRLNASGVSNNRTAIDLYGQNQGDLIKFRAGDDDVMTMHDGGRVEFKKTSSRIASFGVSDANDKYISFYNSSGNFDIGTHTSNNHYLYGHGDVPLKIYTNQAVRAQIDDKGIKQYNRFVSGTILPTAFVGCDSWYDLSGRYSTVATNGNDLTSCTDASGEGRATLIKNTVATGSNLNATLEQFPSGIYGFRFDRASYITGTSHTSGYTPPTGTSPRTLWCIIYNFQELTSEPLNHFLHYGTNTTSQAYGIAFTTSSNEFGQHTWGGNGKEVDADTDIAGGFTNNGTTPRDVYVLFSSYDGGTGETRVYRGGMEGVSSIGSISINTGSNYILHVGSRIFANNSDENCDAVIGEFGAFSRRLTTKEMDLMASSLLLRWS